MTENAIDLRMTVVLFKDGLSWVAQCLEHDVAAQGPSVAVARKRFADSIEAYILSDLKAQREPLAELGQAPKEFFDMAMSSDGQSVELPVFLSVVKPTGRPRISAKATFLQGELAGALG